MKRIVYLALAVVTVASLASCKTSSNSYKQAYEKAVQNDVVQDEAKQLPTEPEVKTDQVDVASVPVREEKVSLVTGEFAIKTYAVVCGSFSLKTNADGVRQRLVADGYPAVVVLNEAGKTYRVIFNSFDTKEDAVRARSAFMAKYPDNTDFQASWILYKK